MYRHLKLIKNYKQRSSLAYCHKSDIDILQQFHKHKVDLSRNLQCISHNTSYGKSYFQINIWIRTHSKEFFMYSMKIGIIQKIRKFLSNGCRK